MTLVAKLIQRSTLHGPQLMRAAVPLPMGYVFDRDNCPFEVTLDGRPLATQWELISRYPETSHSQVYAAVVEIIADGFCRSPYQVFELHKRPPTVVAPPPGVDVRGLVNALRLRAADVFGTVYEAALEHPVAQHRRGRVCSTVEYAVTLEPVAVAAGANPLPRLFQAHAWVTFEAGGRMVGVDLLIHNGPTRAPFPAKVYFKSLELLTPPGWGVEHLWPEFAAGGVLAADPWIAHQLIAPNADGRMHVLLQRQRREFRLALHQGESANAKAYLTSGWGFAIPEHSTTGYSWCNPECAGWGPSRVTLHDPEAQPWGWAPSAIDGQGHDKSLIWSCLASGARFSPVDAFGALGPYHPAGNANGGMTGGEKIWQFECFPVLRGNPTELIATMAWHRCTTDRYHVALYEEDGSVVNLEAYPQGWSFFKGKLESGKEGPFRFSQADKAQEIYVGGTSRAPAYQASLMSMDNHDCAHLARRSSHVICLAWLNDPLARKELQMVAEMAAGEWWHHKSVTQWVADGRLYGIKHTVDLNPGKGSGGLSRANGWAMQAVAAAYQIGDDAYRQRTKPWLEMSLDVMQRAQMASGSWQAVTSGKIYDAVSPPGTAPEECAAAAQGFEHGILTNGLACVVASLDMGGFGTLLSAAAGLANVWWKPNTGGPHTQIGVRPKDISKPSFGTYQEMLDGTPNVSTAIDSYQIGSTLAYGYAIDPNNSAIQAAIARYVGATSWSGVLARLDADGFRYYPDSRCPVFAVVQGARWPAGG